MGTFDEAFKSRIHISLYYPPLKWPQTEKIWTSHVKKVMSNNPNVELDQATLLKYAEELFRLQETQKEYGPVWNGRQIRNAFQSALALAEFQTQPNDPIKLAKGHFEKVSNVSNHFNKYLWGVKRAMTDGDVARLGMLRDDNYSYAPVMTTNSAQAAVNTVDNYNQQLRSTFGQNIQRGPTPTPMMGGFMSGMPGQQAQQMYAMNSMVPTHSSQMNFQAQATQPFGGQVQYQQSFQQPQNPQYQQQAVFQQQQPSPNAYNLQPNPNMQQSFQTMGGQGQFQQLQQQTPQQPPYPSQSPFNTPGQMAAPQNQQGT